MRRQNFNDEFDELLRAFLVSEDETELYKASEFGRRLVDRGIGPDELVAAHLEAVQRILRELPPKRVPEAVVKAHNLLLEAVMAYSLAYHEYTQAEQRRYQQARLYSERLEAREKELRAIIDSIQEGLVLLGRDGEVRLANLAGLRLFAQPSEKVNGQILNGSSLLSADQHFAEAIRQLRQNPSHTIEWETAWNKRQWQISLVPVHAEESELIGTLVLTRDVTDRQQIEAARAQVIREQAARAEMEESHRRLSVLASASALMASSFDYESTLKDVARLVVSDLADYCLIYLIDTSGESRLVAASHANEEQKSALEQFAQDSLADLCNPRSIVAKVFQTRKSEFVAGLPGSPDAQASDSEQRKARRVFEPYRMIAAPLLARERVLGVILLGASDPAKALSPAEILLAEELGQRAALAIENARLYQEAQEALAKLQATQQQIIQQERLRALGEMASGIAHDFNNALAQIIGFIEILLKVRPEQLQEPETVKTYLEWIDVAASDAASIVGRLREFYRHREKDEQFARLDLAKVVANAIHLTQPRWRDQSLAQGIMIHCRAEVADVPPVHGNPAELREVLTNLILNAVDAMPIGGTITIRLWPEGDQVVLTVSDTGIGMSDDVQQRCFEPFYTTKGAEGTGLGLAVVYGIIQRHGGRITVQSRVGGGTTFRIELPQSDQQATEYESSKTEGAVPGVLRILVVDDEEMLRTIIATYLKSDGHQVETARNGHEGLEVFLKGSFDVLVTDRAMPEMGGDTLAYLVKQKAPRTRIILLTGFGESMKATGEMPVAVDAIVSKPVTHDGLRTALARVLVS